MNEEKKSFRPDGTVEQKQTIPNSTGSEQTQSPEKTSVDQKDERQSYEDYNGNSEANAPARAKEGEGER